MAGHSCALVAYYFYCFFWINLEASSHSVLIRWRDQAVDGLPEILSDQNKVLSNGIRPVEALV
ncbi:MAG: hypothetical protein ACYCVG_09425 [Leptospirillum sp.]